MSALGRSPTCDARFRKPLTEAAQVKFFGEAKKQWIAERNAWSEFQRHADNLRGTIATASRHLASVQDAVDHLLNAEEATPKTARAMRPISAKLAEATAALADAVVKVERWTDKPE